MGVGRNWSVDSADSFSKLLKKLRDNAWIFSRRTWKGARKSSSESDEAGLWEAMTKYVSMRGTGLEHVGGEEKDKVAMGDIPLIYVRDWCELLSSRANVTRESR